MPTILFARTFFCYLQCALSIKVKVKVEGYDTIERILCVRMCMTLTVCGILSCVPVAAMWALRHYGFGANILPLFICSPGREAIVPTPGPPPICSSIHRPSLTRTQELPRRARSRREGRQALTRTVSQSLRHRNRK